MIGPPESMRDQVIAAAHAMRTGDWKLCSEYILGIKVYSNKNIQYLFVFIDHYSWLKIFNYMYQYL